MPEFHDLAELALNSTGQSWGNLGYWEQETNYSDANRALANMLGQAAKLNGDSLVFDAGFGCGDQLLLWIEHFDVAGVCGVNFSQSQTRWAKQILSDAGFGASATAIGEGDATDPAAWRSAMQSSSIDCVLALDCAYHFPDRDRFFILAARNLSRAGTISLTDFMLADDFNTRSWRAGPLAMMLKLSKIQRSNFLKKRAYHRQLEAAGFTNIEMNDISAHVMPCFGPWLRAYPRQNNRQMSTRNWLKYRVTGWFLNWAYQNNILRYFVISAVKKADPPQSAEDHP